MADLVYTKMKDLMANNDFDWVSASNVKIMLLNSLYTPNIDHDFVNDVNANEITATGYTGGFNGAGRKAIGGRTINNNAASDRVELKTSDTNTTWTSLTMTGGQLIRYAAIIQEITNDAASPLLILIDFLTNRNPSSTDVVITWDTNGILHLKED